MAESSVERPRLVWSPDSRSLAVGLAPEGGEFPNLYRISVDTPDKAERLTDQPDFGQFPAAWSGSANAILFLEGVHPGSESDILLLPLSGERRPRVLVATPGIDRSPSFSPDGRWFTYSTGAEGQVYIQDVAQSRAASKISGPAGGSNPLWSRDGKKIYFVESGGGLMEVGMDATGNAGTPRQLVSAGFNKIGDMWTRGYSVAPDGRFLLVREIQPERPALSQIQVVVNWFSELMRLADSLRAGGTREKL